MCFVRCPSAISNSHKIPCSRYYAPKPPCRTAYFPKHCPQAGNPHPIPTNRYIRKTTTITNNTTSLVFFHHIRLRSPRLRIRKSCALPPNRSVLSTSRSIRSPRSSTRSIFSVIIPRTSSISRFANASESDGDAELNVCTSERSSALNDAQPYAGSDPNSVLEDG